MAKVNAKYTVEFNYTELKFLVQLLGNLSKKEADDFAGAEFNPGGTSSDLYRDLTAYVEWSES